MNMVHQSFLDDLHKDAERLLENYTIYDQYYNGDHDVTKSIPPKVLASLTSELGTIVNYCPLVVNSAVDYIMGGGVNLEAADKIAEEALLEIYEKNGLLDEEMMKTGTIMGKKGDVYLKLFVTDDSEIKVRVLRPEIVFPRYATDDYMELRYVAIKWFEDADDFIEGDAGRWHAQVFRPDVIDFYVLEADQDTEATQWTHVASENNPLGFIPIVHIKNTIDDLEFGVSDLQVMTDLQDALNKTVTDMLLTMDQTAFQRGVIFGAQSPDGDQLAMEPGAWIEYANSDGEVTVIEPGDITAFLDAIDSIVEQIATVTNLPNLVTSKSGAAPESGFALRTRLMPLEMKADRKIVVLKRRFAELNQMIFKTMELLGQGNFIGTKTEILFKNGLPIDAEAQDATHEMELTNHIKSRRTVMKERGIEDPEEELANIEGDDVLFLEPQPPHVHADEVPTAPGGQQ